MFHRNHPIEPAHVLGFRSVSSNTKEIYAKHYYLGHTASSAYHHYEEEFLKEQGQHSMADSSINSVFTGFTGIGGKAGLEQRMVRSL